MGLYHTPSGSALLSWGEAWANVNSFHLGMGSVTDVVTFVCSAAVANNGC